MRIRNAQNVAQWRLCLGCGSCYSRCPELKISLVNIVDDGIRPVTNGECKECGECIACCPGIKTPVPVREKGTAPIEELLKGWGSVLDVYEGYASNPEIRFRGSSGGAASALALFCLENTPMKNVVQIGQDTINPLGNKTFLTKTKEDLICRTGSRYSPASPCDNLQKIEQDLFKSICIGKPCDIAGFKLAQQKNIVLQEKIGLTISIFCAGTPSQLGTIKWIESLGVDKNSVTDIRYRGMGWPGNSTVLWGTKNLKAFQKYITCWNFLEKFRPFRCYLCPDSTGEFADISCGDPWYRENREDEKGFSLVLVRTIRGKKIVEAAIEGNYLVLEKKNPIIVAHSQPEMLSKRGSIWGRVFVMKLFFLPTPRLENYHLFYFWLKLTTASKVKSIFGTIKRILTRWYFSPQRSITINSGGDTRETMD
jgi:coenzyme F420 hydrogenase subunit beta